MEIYPFENPRSSLATRTMLDGDVRCVTIGGYNSLTIPLHWIKSLRDEELGTGPGLLQVAAGLWQCAKFVAAMVDMDRPFIRGLYAGLSPAEQKVFADKQLAPSTFNLQVAIKDQKATHFSRRRGQPLLTFGTSLMAGMWLRDWEYATVAARLRTKRGMTCMEESWYRAVTHEYAHVLAPYYFKQYAYPHRLQHGEQYCLALYDVRRRFPFTMFPAIPVMPRIDYQPASWKRQVVYRQGNKMPDTPVIPSAPVTIVPHAPTRPATTPDGGHFVKARYQTYITPDGEKGRRKVG